MSGKTGLDYLLLLALLTPLNGIYSVEGNTEITVASYNLWNVMFMWETRKFYIAEMITQSNADVIGFQEVRSDLSGLRNQLTELQALLSPEYKHHSYHPISNVSPAVNQHGPPGWEQEGLGIMSKYPIMLSHAVSLKRSSDSPDKNKRVLVHVQLDVRGEEFDVTLAHFSYDKKQQCQNAVDVINYLASVGSERSVVMGDFNAYEDFPWPVSAVIKGSFISNGECKPDKYFDPQDSGRGYGYVDAWIKAHGDAKGYTFSNMPEPGLISRPDRILVSNTGLGVITAKLLGGTQDYKHSIYYRYLNMWNRLKSVINFANASTQNSPMTYTCHQDCGPHGSCRCGMCVRGGNKNNCDLRYCYECDAAHYTSFLSLLICAVVFAIFVAYLFIKLLSKHFLSRGRRLSSPRLFFLFTNKMLVIFLAAVVLVMYFLTLVNFSDTIETVNGVLLEEMFPSDHLMIVATLKITYR